MDRARASESGSGSDQDQGSDLDLGSVSDRSRHSLRTVHASALRSARDPSGWAQFWATYPVHTHEHAAVRAWDAYDVDVAEVLSALAWQMPAWAARPGGAPSAATYLRRRQWEDPRPAVPSEPLTRHTRQTHQNAPGRAFARRKGECAYHADGRNSGRRSAFYDGSCFECRHVAARHKRHASREPMSAAELVPAVMEGKRCD